MIQKMVLATGNPGKCKEMFGYLKSHVSELIPQTHFFSDSVEETGTTFIENAIIKARYASLKTGLPALADDSGLVVAALGGQPGVHSARYAGDDATDKERITYVLKNMEQSGNNDRRAYFACALAFFREPGDPMPIVSCGRWDGSLLKKPQGNHGFGYDPIFWVQEKACSAAELSSSDKNIISHRAIAMQRLLEQW